MAHSLKLSKNDSSDGSRRRLDADAAAGTDSKRQAHEETTLGAAVDAGRARLPARRGAELKIFSLTPRRRRDARAMPASRHFYVQVRRRPVVGPLSTFIFGGTETRERRTGRRHRGGALRLRHALRDEGRGVVRDSRTLKSTEAATDLREFRCGVGAVSYTHLTLPTICSV